MQMFHRQYVLLKDCICTFIFVTRVFLCNFFLSRSGAVNTTNYKYVTCLKYTAFYWSRSFNLGKGQDLYLCPFNTHVKYCLQANWQRPSIVDFQIAAAVIVIKMFRDYNCHLKKLPVLSLCGWWRKRAIWVRMDQTHHKHSRCRVQIQMKRTPMCKVKIKDRGYCNYCNKILEKVSFSCLGPLPGIGIFWKRVGPECSVISQLKAL